jgi:hypothetical protein
MNFNAPEFQEIQEKVNIALQQLYENDHFLITNTTNERTVTHKFAEYLQVLFREWNVDCEYNRVKDRKKSIPGQKYSYPDIIIHKRNNIENLLVVEAKKCNALQKQKDEDKKKVKKFIEDTNYQYCFGLLLVLL